MVSDDPVRNEMLRHARRMCGPGEFVNEIVVFGTLGGTAANWLISLIFISLGTLVASLVASLISFSHASTLMLVASTCASLGLSMVAAVRSRTKALAVTSERLLLIDFGQSGSRTAKLIKQFPLSLQLPEPTGPGTYCSQEFGETLYIVPREFPNLRRANQSRVATLTRRL